ncbi:MAG: PilZ domain-containing protein [Candidatus Omnitrophota bacterium]
MTKKSRVERRKHPRVKRILCIHHRLHKRKGKQMKDAWHWHLSDTENMSMGGVLFQSDIHYQVNDVIEIKIVMSGVLEIFNGFGKVVRVEQKKKGYLYPTAVALSQISNRRRKIASARSII